jgi:putative addiction module killer protein
LEVTPLEVEVYSAEEGKQPFTEWLNSLKDRKGADKILLRIRRIQTGNLGDYKPIASGVLATTLSRDSRQRKGFSFG